MQIWVQSTNHILGQLPRRVPKKSESRQKKIEISHWRLSRVARKPSQKKHESGRETFPKQAFAQCQFQHHNGLNLRKGTIYYPVSSSTIQNHHHAKFHKCIIYQSHMYQSQQENHRTGKGPEYFCTFCVITCSSVNSWQCLTSFADSGVGVAPCPNVSFLWPSSIRVTSPYSKSDMKLVMAPLTSSLTMLLSNHSTSKSAVTFATGTSLELMRAMTLKLL